MYDSAGEAYMNKGENELAIEYYKKSMLLNADDIECYILLQKILVPVAGLKYLECGH